MSTNKCWRVRKTKKTPAREGGGGGDVHRRRDLPDADEEIQKDADDDEDVGALVAKVDQDDELGQALEGDGAERDALEGALGAPEGDVVLEGEELKDQMEDGDDDRSAPGARATPSSRLSLAQAASGRLRGHPRLHRRQATAWSRVRR